MGAINLSILMPLFEKNLYYLRLKLSKVISILKRNYFKDELFIDLAKKSTMHLVSL